MDHTSFLNHYNFIIFFQPISSPILTTTECAYGLISNVTFSTAGEQTFRTPRFPGT